MTEHLAQGGQATFSLHCPRKLFRKAHGHAAAALAMSSKAADGIKLRLRTPAGVSRAVEDAKIS